MTQPNNQHNIYDPRLSKNHYSKWINGDSYISFTTRIDSKIFKFKRGTAFASARGYSRISISNNRSDQSESCSGLGPLFHYPSGPTSILDEEQLFHPHCVNPDNQFSLDHLSEFYATHLVPTALLGAL